MSAGRPAGWHGILGRPLQTCLVLAILAFHVTSCVGSSGEPTRLADFDVLNGLDRSDQGGVLRTERRIEQLTAECMRAEGFEYRPIDSSAEVQRVVDMPDADAAFRREYGYGVTTTLAVDQQEDEPTDPNAAYLEGLSPADREAWIDTLYGEREQFGDGCRGTAVAAAGSSALQDLDPLLTDLEDRIEADPRMVAAIQDWSACMAEASYSFPDFEAPRAFISERFDALRESGNGGSLDESAVASLREQELRIAAVDQRCRDEWVADVRGDVEPEYETEFVAENRELLEDLPDFGGD